MATHVGDLGQLIQTPQRRRIDHGVFGSMPPINRREKLKAPFSLPHRHLP